MSQAQAFFSRKLLLRITCLFMAFCAVTTAHSEIFRWKDANGNVHFSDRKSAKHKSKKVEVQINSIKGVTHTRSRIDTGKKVVMYSASWCGVCKVARHYFKKHKIRFTEYDVEKSLVGSADFKRLNGRGVPVILVGRKRMNGFSRTGFKAMYGS